MNLSKALLGAFFVLAASAGIAYAAPNNINKADNNPNVLAYHPTGIHAIPLDPIVYVTGTDLVMGRGNSGQIEAWETSADGHGYHSVWNISKNSTCPSDMVLVPHAYPAWGTYLVPGADYCVHVNQF